MGLDKWTIADLETREPLNLQSRFRQSSIIDCANRQSNGAIRNR